MGNDDARTKKHPPARDSVAESPYLINMHSGVHHKCIILQCIDFQVLLHTLQVPQTGYSPVVLMFIGKM